MTKDKVIPLKICLVGDSGTGKTSLLSRLGKNEFELNYDPTIAVDRISYELNVNDKSIKTLIFDIGGDEKYRGHADCLYQDTDGILLVYDITDHSTFENITGWLKNITRLGNGKTIIKLIGNKSDLDHQRVVPFERAQQLANDYGISFTETSALDTSNVIETFQWTIQQICSTSGKSDNGLFSTCAFISNCMSKNIHDGEQQLQDLSLNQRPFHVVLIDFHEAAKWKIRCIEKPLDDPDLKYVAISYRWGELQETVINTGLGYTVKITSFDIFDFYRLCEAMTTEMDLKDINYVWVDAICVDQTNYERRKATIHQMSNIYERATFILAVPDLHLQHLKNSSESSRHILYLSCIYKYYLSYIIHGDSAGLDYIDNIFLDNCNVPNDPELRRLLKTYTDHFMAGFIEYRPHHEYYNVEHCLDHIYETSQPPPSTTTNRNSHHDCQLLDCPLDFFDENVSDSRKEIADNNNTQQWKQLVQERRSAIQKSMELMMDLIRDWSTRVWVISEYNIAKKKNNMKYWFVQLYSPFLQPNFRFFKFDFQVSEFSNMIENVFHQKSNTPCAVYFHFHRTIMNQLNQQSFFEMILKSKASKNEDRFYAIFPLTDYRNMITNKSKVDEWKIDTLYSVKLKLYEIMNTKDKLNLLFMSGNRLASQVGRVLPTFATSSINWRFTPLDFFQDNDMKIPEYNNFNLASNDIITLCHQKKLNLILPYLNLKPKEYFIFDHTTLNPDLYEDYSFYDRKSLWSPLESDDDPDMININIYIFIGTRTFLETFKSKWEWSSNVISLNGNFKNNNWVLQRPLDIYDPPIEAFTHHILDDSSAGFNIY